ncbi:MAG: hypothetical protein ABFD75_01745 [Smithella sp.]
MGKTLWWLLIVIIWIPGVSAGAAEPVLTVDPDDSPLVIHGKLDGQTTTFGGSVRLTVTGGDIKEVLLLASGVKQVGDDSVVIDRSNVTIPAGMSLTNGRPRDIRVTVNNVMRPGEYDGNLKFLLPGQAEEKAVKIGLKLSIDPKPKVQPVFSGMTFHLVRSRNLVADTVATWLLSPSAVREKWYLHLDNQTLAPVEVTDVTVVMRGEKTGQAVSPGIISITMPRQLPAGQVEPIPMTIHRNNLSPDRYQGTLRFKVKGADDPVTVNADLNLRDGPIWAVLVILAGIFVGRLARGMSTPEAQKQIKLLPLLYKIRQSADRIQDADAQAYLAGQIEDAKARIGSAGETEGELSQMLDKLQSRIEFLIALEGLKDKLAKSNLDALREELEPKIKNARQSLIENRTEDAERLRKEVEARFQQARQDTTMGLASDLYDFFTSFSSTAEQWSKAEKAPAPGLPGGKHWGWLAKMMATLSGIEFMNAEFRYWFVSPLLFLILLVGLALLGLQTLYINAGSTFGAGGLYDYLGLFLWGLSADVAQRTLQTLQPSKQG